MKTSRVLMLSASVALLLSVAASASTYYWNNAKRPPVSLAEAVRKAEALLGDDAKNRYCVLVTLNGDKSQAGKEGWWNLYYAASDGSQKQVVIDMKGEGYVTPINGAVDREKHKGRRTDLADVRRRLEDLLARQGIKAKFTAEEGRLLVTHHVREFQVYAQQDDGSFADKLETTPGPQGDGFWLEVRIVDKPDARAYGYLQGVYWNWHRGTFFLTEPEKYLAMDFRCGPKFSPFGSSVEFEIISVFGESTPNDFDPFR